MNITKGLFISGLLFGSCVLGVVGPQEKERVLPSSKKAILKAPEPGNLLVNGGFENGENHLLNWNFTNNDPLRGHPHLVTDKVHSGEYAVQFEADHSNSEAYLQIGGEGFSVLQNTVYRFEYWVNIQEASQDLSFSTYICDGISGGTLKWIDFSSQVLTKNIEGWKRVRSLVTVPGETGSSGSAIIGFRAYSGKATVTFDDVSFTKVRSADGLGQNFDFEMEYEGMPFNWGYSGDGEVELFEGASFPDSPGAHSLRFTHASNADPAILSSIAVPVLSKRTYEISFWGKIEGEFDANGYFSFTFLDDADSQIGRPYEPTWQYHLYGSSDWQRVSYFIPIAEGATKVKLKAILLGKNASLSLDNISFEEAGAIDGRYDDNPDFERVDRLGKPVNWHLSGSRSKISVLAGDETIYHRGKRSAHVINDGILEKTLIENSALIPVTTGQIFEFSAYYTSKNCDPGMQISFNLYYLDENGHYFTNEWGDKLQIIGETKGLNASSHLDGWKQLYTRSLIPSESEGKKVRYVAYSFVLSDGYAELWLDDISLLQVEEEGSKKKLEYHTDFRSADERGKIANCEVQGGSFAIGNDGARLTSEKGAKIFFPIYSFLTGYTYSVDFDYASDVDGVLALDFYSSDGKQLADDPLNEPLMAGEHLFHRVFVAPSAAYVIVRIELLNKGGLLARSFKTYQEGVPSSKGQWEGNWVWHNENPYDYPDSYRYFRYSFTLPAKASYAPLQYTADDKFQLYVNGTYIASNWQAGNDSWGDIQIAYLNEHLVAGENVIAFKAFNLISDAGILFDGRFSLEDGSSYVLASSRKVKSTVLVREDPVNGDASSSPDWTKVGFDDSSWRRCKEYGKPPASPWGPVYYNSNLYIDNSVEISQVNAPAKVVAGTLYQFEMALHVNSDFTSNVSFQVDLLIRNSVELITTATLKTLHGDTDMSQWRKGMDVRMKFGLDIPIFLPNGLYELRLNTPSLKISNGDEYWDNRFLTFAIEESPHKNDPLISSVKMYNGAPALFINDKVQSPVSYLRPDLNVYRQTDAESRIYQSTYELYITYQGCLGKGGQDQIWLPNGELDFESFDKAILTLLSTNANAYVMINLGMFAPHWWMDQNPGEVTSTCDKNGNIKSQEGVSFASKKWREEAGEQLAKLIEHMRQQNYYNRVFGLRLTAGHTYEFMNYGSSGITLPDYSEAALKGFRQYLKAKYGTNSKLRLAWRDDSVTFSSATIPTFLERGKSHMGGIYDASLDRRNLDYNWFLAEQSADTLLYWAKICKEKTNNEKIVGAYYGYLWTFGGYDAVATSHSCLKKVLESPYVDFIASPINYNERLLGENSTFMSMVDTVQAYGKLYMLEQDNRTFKSDGFSGFSWDGLWDFQVGEYHTIQDTIHQWKRDFANNFMNGTGYWHYDMYGGWLDDPALYKAMATEKRIYDDSLKLDSNSYQNEVAVFVSDDMYMYYTTDTVYNSAYIVNNSLLLKQRKQLAAMGVGYDMYAISTIQAGKVPPHKVNIFLSPYEVSDAEREAISSYLKKDQQIGIFVYLSGLSNGETSNINNMEDLTGFRLAFENRQAALQVRFLPSEDPLAEGLEGKVYGNNIQFASPFCYIDDSEAKILGNCADGGKAGLGIKEFDSWTSIYSSATCLPARFLRNVLKKANIHVYSEDYSDVIWRNGQYLAIHSGVGGQKSLNLNGNFDVYDEFKGEWVGHNVNSLSFDLVANDTKIFRLVKPGSGSLKSPTNNAIYIALGAGVGTLFVGASSYGIVHLSKKKKKNGGSSK